jgi:hypothetical protein
MLVFALGAGVNAQCGDCEQPGNMIRLPTGGFFNRIQKYSLPLVSKIKLRELPDTPVTFDVVVGKDGIPCKVHVLNEVDRHVSDLVGAAIPLWRFRPPIIANGRRCCMASRVFVYLKRVGGRIVLVIPGLNDRPK